MKNNLANIQPLRYCQKRLGNTGTCSHVATYITDLCPKGEKESPIARQEQNYRCEEHKDSTTVSKEVYRVKEFDQSFTLHKINQFLKSIVGKNIKSSAHTARELEVKYLKDNGAVMCYQNHSKQWKYVYYHQIEEILN